jgi:hypothetical protein
MCCCIAGVSRLIDSWVGPLGAPQTQLLPCRGRSTSQTALITSGHACTAHLGSGAPSGAPVLGGPLLFASACQCSCTKKTQRKKQKISIARHRKRNEASACALQTVDNDEVDEGEGGEFQYYQVGDKTLRISTTHSEEKVNALNMLACYAEHLQEHFAPYCADVAKVIEHVMTVPLLNDEEMRGACAALMPSLLDDLQLAREKGTWPGATDQAVSEMYSLLLAAMLKARRPPTPRPWRACSANLVLCIQACACLPAQRRQQDVVC